jgi:UDP-N-acetyl-D-galactosamine dehydrogenase
MNDSMGSYVATETVKMMIKKGATIKNSRVLVLGITFKENCPDIRNSRVIDIIREFETYNINVDVYDPWASAEEVKHEYDFDLICDQSDLGRDYEAIVLAVSHDKFKALDIQGLKASSGVIFDVKSMLPEGSVDARL